MNRPPIHCLGLTALTALLNRLNSIETSTAEELGEPPVLICLNRQEQVFDNARIHRALAERRNSAVRIEKKVTTNLLIKMRPKKIGIECLAVVTILSVFFIPEGIMCYQCISTNNSHPFQCNEFLTSDIDMVPTSCDGVFGAQYCVKHVGRFEATVLALDCYQCTTADEWKCMDSELVLSALEPKSCDHVFEAQYCVKTVGKYGDGIGTKRFCSAVHLGNYCDYVQNQGDILEYRTCLYTCTGDGCNPASTPKPNSIISVASSLTLLWLFSPRR